MRTWSIEKSRYRGLPLFLMGLAAVVVVAGWTALGYVRGQLVATAGESVLMAAVDIAGGLDLVLFDRFREIRTAAASPTLGQASPAELTRYLSTLKGADPFYLWLGVADTSGTVIAATTPVSIGVELSSRPWFRRLQAGAEAEIRDTYTSIAIAAPLRDEGGHFAGALLAHIGLGALQRIWLRTAYVLRDRWGSWIDWQILTPDGQVIDGDLRRRRPTRLPFTRAPAGTSAVVPASGYFEDVHPDSGAAVVTGYAQTLGYMDYPGLGWIVVVRVDRAGILTPVDRVVRALGVVGLVVVVPIFGLLLWSVRRLRVEWLEAREATARAVAAEAARQAREAQIRAIVETASDGIVTTDAVGRVESVNLAGERMFGYEPGMLATMPPTTSLGALIPSLGESRSAAAFEFPALRTGFGASGGEFVARRRDGAEFPVELGVSAVRFQGRRVFTAIVRDISVRRRAETRAREHQSALAHALRVSSLGEMAAGLAHELHQPLTAIATYALAGSDELRAGAVNPSQVVEVLGRIEAEAHRAGAITHRLRDFIRKTVPRFEPTSLTERIRNVLGLMDAELVRCHVDVVCDLVPEGVRVHADRVQIEQVLVNLLQNAIDSIGDSERRDGRVWIRSARVPAGRVEVSVRDNGAGVSATVAERMFDAFFTTKPDGLGMGLAISRAIVESHHGRLWVVPDPGGGVTVSFVLPEYREGNGDAF